MKRNHLILLSAALLLAGLACGPVTTVVATLTPEPPPSGPAGETPTSPPPVVPTLSPTPGGLAGETPTASPIAPTPGPSAEPTVPGGWLLYTNPLFGYRFYYPPEATLTEAGVDGFPTDELPPGKTPEQYMAELQAMYDNALCVGVNYEAGYVVVSAPANQGFRYSLCGRTGVGAGSMVEKQDTFVIAGGVYTATGYEFMGVEVPCDQLPCHNETLVLQLPDGTRIEYGAAPVEGVSYADYLSTTRPVLLQIVATFVPGP